MQSFYRNPIFTYVACNLRFHPVLQYLKQEIDTRNVFYTKVVSSSYLPEWRPEQDYRDSYSAKKEPGGGVLLDLIHEPDYCSWLFGPIETIHGMAGRCSNLEIETEDYADITIFHTTGIRSNIHLDYFGRKTQRQIEIFGKDFQIIADLMNKTVTKITDDGESVITFDPIDRDYTYIEELKYFFKCLDNNEQPMNHVEEHYDVLKPVIDFKKKIMFENPIPELMQPLHREKSSTLSLL